MDEVVRHRERQVPTDGPRRRAGGVRGADERAYDRHGVAPGDVRHDHVPAGDELDQLAEERLCTVLVVMPLRQVPVDAHHPQGRDSQSLPLDAGEDLAHQPPPDRVRLADHQGSLVAHAALPRFRRDHAPTKSGRASATV